MFSMNLIEVLEQDYPILVSDKYNLNQTDNIPNITQDFFFTKNFQNFTLEDFKSIFNCYETEKSEEKSEYSIEKEQKEPDKEVISHHQGMEEPKTSISPLIMEPVSEEKSKISKKAETFPWINKEKKNLCNFKTLLYHKRGRKPFIIKENKVIHGATGFDNLQRKIQVHYLSFLINLANDLVTKFFGKESGIIFKRIAYEIKRKVSQSFIEEMKSKTFGEILEFNVKQKYFAKNHNEKTFSYVCEKSAFIKKVFELNYLFIFQKYYFNGGLELKEFEFDNEKIKLSPQTKSYFFLKKKNKNVVKLLDNVLKNVYFSDKNYLEKKKFIIKKTGI